MSHKRIWLTALGLAVLAASGLAAFSEGDCKQTPTPPPAPSSPSPPRILTVSELAARIDAHIDARLAEAGVQPAPLASDAEFMRRVYLDLAGRIPSEQEARTFLADKAADRRARLVDKLLDSPLHVRHMANTWQTALAPPEGEGAILSRQSFKVWLDKQVKENVPYDKLVRELLTSPLFNPYAYSYGYGGSTGNFGVSNAPNATLLTYSYDYPPPALAPPPPSLRPPVSVPALPAVLPSTPPVAVTTLLPSMPVPLTPPVRPSSLVQVPVPPVSLAVQPAVMTLPAPLPPPVAQLPNLGTIPSAVPITTVAPMPIYTTGLATIGNGGSFTSTYLAYQPVYAVPPPPTPGMFYFEANGYKPETLAATTSRRFLGVRLECAQCHNHPFAKWTRTQFYEFAAFFANVQAQFGNPYATVSVSTSSVNGSGFVPVANSTGVGREIKMPGSDKVVKARFLDGANPSFKDNVESRHTLADWLTSPENKLFARTGANRLWAQLFGIGIIDPIDDEPSDENPISHPELLTELSEQFVAHKFDVKYLIRAITASKAYQRTSAASNANQNDPRLFARMAVKGLTPEQLWDNLSMVTGHQEAPPAPQQWATQAAIFESGGVETGHTPGSPRSQFVRMFATLDGTTETRTSVLQALTLMNGKVITDATRFTSNARLATLLANSSKTNSQKIESLYLSTLSRLPREEEAARLLRYVEGQADQRAALSDLLWALLNSAEFRFNH